MNARQATQPKRRKRSVLLLVAAVAVCLFAALALFIWHPFNTPPSLDESLLRDGDILFIRGSTLRGLAVVATDGGGEYSHVGIVSIEGGRAFVINASPDGGEENVVRRQSLADFLAIANVRQAAVHRLKNDAWHASRAAANARRYFGERRPFDNAFSLKSADKLYCTELVWRAYLEAGVDLCEGRTVRVAVPFVKEPVILPSSLLPATRLQLILQAD